MRGGAATTATMMPAASAPETTNRNSHLFLYGLHYSAKFFVFLLGGALILAWTLKILHRNALRDLRCRVFLHAWMGKTFRGYPLRRCHATVSYVLLPSMLKIPVCAVGVSLTP